MPPHFIHEITTKVYDVIGVDELHTKVNKIHKNGVNSIPIILLIVLNFMTDLKVVSTNGITEVKYHFNGRS